MPPSPVAPNLTASSDDSEHVAPVEQQSKAGTGKVRLLPRLFSSASADCDNTVVLGRPNKLGLSNIINVLFEYETVDKPNRLS